MSEQRINKLLDNLAEARKLISVMQSKIDRQREDISRKDLRISHLVADKREMTTKLNELREAHYNAGRR
jgi:chromosome segregation ATPase